VRRLRWCGYRTRWIWVNIIKLVEVRILLTTQVMIKRYHCTNKDENCEYQHKGNKAIEDDMDNKLVDTGVGMQSEKFDMDKYNLEHMVEKEVAEHEVDCEHVQHEEEREEEAE
jgi:hypothetical protein